LAQEQVTIVPTYEKSKRYLFAFKRDITLTHVRLHWSLRRLRDKQPRKYV